MSAPVDLAAVRRTKSDNAADWTPRDALVYALEQIDAGEIDPKLVYIATVSKPKVRDGNKEPTAFYDHVCAGGTNMEFAGLLAIHLGKLSLIL